MKLVSFDHPILTEKAQPFDFDAPGAFDEAKKLADGLIETMNEHAGLGLAAPQVGMPLRVFAMKTEPDVVIFNPRIVDVSDEWVDLDEGCLSYPGLLMKVKRPRLIRARFQLMDGEYRTMKFDGMTARIFQHELDHLDGVRHVDRVGPLKLKIAIRKARKRGHPYVFSDFRRNAS